MKVSRILDIGPEWTAGKPYQTKFLCFLLACCVSRSGDRLSYRSDGKSLVFSFIKDGKCEKLCKLYKAKLSVFDDMMRWYGSPGDLAAGIGCERLIAARLGDGLAFGAVERTDPATTSVRLYYDEDAAEEARRIVDLHDNDPLFRRIHKEMLAERATAPSWRDASGGGRRDDALAGAPGILDLGAEANFHEGVETRILIVTLMCLIGTRRRELLLETRGGETRSMAKKERADDFSDFDLIDNCEIKKIIDTINLNICNSLARSIGCERLIAARLGDGLAFGAVERTDPATTSVRLYYDEDAAEKAYQLFIPYYNHYTSHTGSSEGE